MTKYVHAVVSEQDRYHTDVDGEKFILVEQGRTQRIKIVEDEKDLEPLNDSISVSVEDTRKKDKWVLVTNNSDSNLRVYDGDKLAKIKAKEVKKEIKKESKEEEQDDASS